MSVTGVIFAIFYALCLIGGIFVSPKIAVLGYLSVYTITPAGRWWGKGLSGLGVRFSQFMVISLVLGALIHFKHTRLTQRPKLQEVLLILFVLITWISIPLGLPGIEGGENFALKLTKVAVFVLLFGRVIITLKDFEHVLWLLLVTAAFMAIESSASGVFQGGRIDQGIGGTDFSEGNFMAAHFAMLLPFAGLLFFKKGLLKKATVAGCCVLVLNGFFMCRSRGATLALAAGSLISALFSPKGIRGKVFFGMAVAVIGAVFLIDPGFVGRVQTINTDIGDVENLEPSSAGRVLAWRAAIDMFKDHPMGIGQGNFKTYVNQYQPGLEGKDTHNTYLRCLAELGAQGLLVLLALIANAYITLLRLNKRALRLPNAADYRWHVFSCFAAITILCASSMFITHVYVEELYLLLSFPSVLEAISKDSERNSPQELDAAA